MKIETLEEAEARREKLRRRKKFLWESSLLVSMMQSKPASWESVHTHDEKRFLDRTYWKAVDIMRWAIRWGYLKWKVPER